MKVVVIETHEESGVEWGLSFNGYNPDFQDYYKMPDKETAFRLMERLTKSSPITNNEPVTSPSNKF
jgi:hypothetical protein